VPVQTQVRPEIERAAQVRRRSNRRRSSPEAIVSRGRCPRGPDAVRVSFSPDPPGCAEQSALPDRALRERHNRAPAVIRRERAPGVADDRHPGTAAGSPEDLGDIGPCGRPRSSGRTAEDDLALVQARPGRPSPRPRPSRDGVSAADAAVYLAGVSATGRSSYRRCGWRARTARGDRLASPLTTCVRRVYARGNFAGRRNVKATVYRGAP
jgi:hypothetical protein